MPNDTLIGLDEYLTRQPPESPEDESCHHICDYLGCSVAVFAHPQWEEDPEDDGGHRSSRYRGPYYRRMDCPEPTDLYEMYCEEHGAIMERVIEAVDGMMRVKQ